MRLEKRWIWRSWAGAAQFIAISLAQAQDAPAPAPDSTLVVAAVTPIAPIQRPAPSVKPELVPFTLAPLELKHYATASTPPPPALGWSAVVHASFFPSYSDTEYREMRINDAVFEAIPRFRPTSLVEQAFDVAMGSLDWTMRSMMRGVRGSTFSETFDPCVDERTLTDSFLSMIDRPVRQEGSMSAFLVNLLKQENRFFYKFQGSYLNPVGAELGFESYSSSQIMHEQINVVIDALQRTLVEQSNAGDLSARFRQEGFEMWRYRGKDYYILAPAITAYVYYRGVDYRFKVDNTKIRVALSPVYEIMDSMNSHDRLLGALGVEISGPIRGIKFIAATGFNNGRAELDFIGVGTDLEIVRKALVAASPE